MKSLVGHIASSKYHQHHILADLPKTNWRAEFVENKSIAKVYHTSTNGVFSQIAHHNTTFEFRKYLTQLAKTVKLKGLSTKFGNFSEMCEYGYEGNVTNTFQTPHLTESVAKFYIDNTAICLVPWNDGVMVQSIVVPNSKRKNGIGTKVMNILYNVSEGTNIPLYLIPYPSEKFEVADERELVSKLENWYLQLGFAKIENTIDETKVWCNMD